MWDFVHFLAPHRKKYRLMKESAFIAMCVYKLFRAKCEKREEVKHKIPSN